MYIIYVFETAGEYRCFWNKIIIYYHNTKVFVYIAEDIGYIMFPITLL